MWLLALANKKTASVPFYALLFGGLLLVLPLGCGTPPPAEQPPPAVVVWKTASANYLEEWTEFVGTTVPLPNRIARIGSRVEGTVVSVLTGSPDKPIAEGQQVDKGAVLVQLDTTVVKNSLAEAEATQDALVEDQKQAQFAVDLATREVARLQDLMKGSAGGVPLVSAAEREKAIVGLKDAQSKLKASGNRLTAGAKRLETLREQLQFFTLTSPIKGRLGRMQVVPGQTLSVGTPVADVIDVEDEIDVLCFVPSSVVARMKKPGQPARTGEADKDPAGEALGEVKYIADQAEPDTGNFAIKVRFPNKEKQLRANSVVRFCIMLKEGKEAPSLPEAAIQEDEIPPTVVLVTDITTEKNKEGKEETKGVARRMQAELGLRARHLHQIEIVSLTDPEKEPGKPKVRVEIKDNQLLVDGKEAQFVVEGAQGLQTGDAVKLDMGDD